jgi:hypothetical protein
MDNNSTSCRTHVSGKVRVKVLLLPQTDVSPPTETATFLSVRFEATQFLSALHSLRTALSNLSKLKSTRLNQAAAHLVKTDEAFAPLRDRLSRSHWLRLTDDEKRLRKTISHERAEHTSVLKSCNHAEMQNRISQKFFTASEKKRPVKLKKAERIWLETHRADFGAFCTVKNGFMIPSAPTEFNFSASAFDVMGKRLVYGLLTPQDAAVLSRFGVPVERGVVWPRDAEWKKTVDAKLTLYKLLKSRQALNEPPKMNASRGAKPTVVKSEVPPHITSPHIAPPQRSETAVINAQKSFKRVTLDDGVPINTMRVATDDSQPRPEKAAPPVQAFKRVDIACEEEVPTAPAARPKENLVTKFKQFAASLLPSRTVRFAH